MSSCTARLRSICPSLGNRQVIIDTGARLGRRGLIDIFKSDIMMERLDDAGAQPTNIGWRHVGAFRDLKRIESDEINRGYLASLQRRKYMRVRFGMEVRED
ncbi:hypothetical protein APSETT444_005801 [Aspergillus pseudonomiae]